ncbi:MAG: outer membrane lipoprotein-sorting protein [Myxococcota bacterium]
MSRIASLAGRAAASFGFAVLWIGVAAADDLEPLTFEDGLTGQNIYERVLDNRFRSFTQVSRLISEDRRGRKQESRFRMKWQDVRNGDGAPDDGVLTRTMVRYTHPFDLRHSGYLILVNEGRSPDQFVYYPSRRRIVRVSLRSEAIYGTDFSFEDVVPREAGDFRYRRLRNDEFRGVDVYVVELFPEEIASSEYSRIRVFIDRQRAVVLRARYWDEAGVEVKEFRAPPELVRQYEGIFVPTRAVMKHLLNDSATTLVVDELEANPPFDDETFNLRRLEGR